VESWLSGVQKNYFIALVKGSIGSDTPVLARVRAQSTVADVFGSLRSGPPE
jgi:hypothetical protein